MPNKITLIHSTMPPIEEYIEEIRPLWETLMLTNNGGIHRELENQLTEYLAVDNLNLFANGHTALQLTIEAFDLSGEVITSPFTFGSTTHAIIRSGLTPVFCDISLEDCTIDVNKIEELITEKTSGIIPIHIYGNACDVEKIQTLAQKYHLKVIYDAAQAFGVKVRGKGIGTFGDASAFSFNATKTFHTIEGGAASSLDSSIKEKLTKLANYGKNLSIEYGMELIGVNGKMNEFQAAMGICCLRYIDEALAIRKKIDRYYRCRLEKIEGISLIPFKDHDCRNCTYFPILVDEKKYGMTRDELAIKLLGENISSKKYFSPITPDFNCYKQKFGNLDLPMARYAADHVLALPMHAYISEDDADKVCSVIESRR